MGWMLKYCKNCKTVYTKGENECRECGATLITSDHSADTYNTLDTTKKAEAIARCFGADYSQWEYDKEPDTTSDKLRINIGGCLKAVSVISIVLSIVGAYSIAETYNITIGITAFYMSFVFFLLVYGIGEICTLLVSINSKLK